MRVFSAEDLDAQRKSSDPQVGTLRPASAPGRTRTSDRLLRSYSKPNAVPTRHFPAHRRTKLAQLDGVLIASIPSPKSDYRGAAPDHGRPNY